MMMMVMVMVTLCVECDDSDFMTMISVDGGDA